MEDDNNWYYKIPSKSELDAALKELISNYERSICKRGYCLAKENKELEVLIGRHWK